MLPPGSLAIGSEIDIKLNNKIFFLCFIRVMNIENNAEKLAENR